MAIATFTSGQVLTAAQVNALQANDYNQTVSTKTASYVLVAADKGTRVVMNSASATTITVNTSLFSAGDTLFIQNIGAGVCTITAGTATVSSAGSLALAANAGGTLYFTSAGVSIFLASAGASASGLTLINTTTFTGVTSISLPASTFTSTYENYKILISFTSTVDDGQIFFRLRASGTDNTAGYSWGIIGRNATGTVYNNYAANDGVGFFVLNVDAGLPDTQSAEITLFNPQLARKTKYTAAAAGTENAGAIVSMFGAGSHSSTSAFDSATFYNGSVATNIAGKVYVYGIQI